LGGLRGKMEDYRVRSIVKTISWRVLATLATMFIVFAFTGKVKLSVGIGLVEAVSKMVLYYLHERTWGKISWGKLKHPLADLVLKKELTPEDKELIQQRLKELGYM